jgi:hypothetical protein
VPPHPPGSALGGARGGRGPEAVDDAAGSQAARFAQFTAGRSVFDKVGANTSFASAAASARSARSFSAGLNWYATQSVKWQTDFETTSFDGGATGGNRPVERALLTRIQLSY